MEFLDAIVENLTSFQWLTSQDGSALIKAVLNHLADHKKEKEKKKKEKTMHVLKEQLTMGCSYIIIDNSTYIERKEKSNDN